MVLQVSERRACRAIGQIRPSYRYVPRPDHKRERLRERIIALAKEDARAGTWEKILCIRSDGTKASKYQPDSRSKPDSGAPMGCASGCGPRTAITSGRMIRGGSDARRSAISDSQHSGRVHARVSVLGGGPTEPLARCAVDLGGSVPESRGSDA